MRSSTNDWSQDPVELLGSVYDSQPVKYLRRVRMAPTAPDEYSCTNVVRNPVILTKRCFRLREDRWRQASEQTLSLSRR